MASPVGGRTDLVRLPALHLACCAITNSGAFEAIAASPEDRSMSDWAAAAGRNRWVVVTLVVCLLGLVGTPPPRT